MSFLVTLRNLIFGEPEKRVYAGTIPLIYEKVYRFFTKANSSYEIITSIYLIKKVSNEEIIKVEGENQFGRVQFDVEAYKKDGSFVLVVDPMYP